MSNAKLIKELPKVELHCHLDGSIPLATLEKLALKDNKDLNELKKATAPKKCLDLKEYLQSFDVILPLLQSKENLRIATHDLVEEVAKENVYYIELRFAPLLHRRNNLTVKEIIEAVTAGITDAQEKYDIHVNLLVSAMRHHDEEVNIELINTIQELEPKLVVGFDFAGDEAQIDNDVIKTPVKLMANSALNLTLHSGECGCAQNVIEAIHLGATRIGHGIAIKDSPEAIELCKSNDILLEVCPSSNIQTNAIASWDAFPLRMFLDSGLKFCINTDNRTVSQTNLSNEYTLLMEHCGLTFSEMKRLNLNAIEASFAKTSVKEAVTEKINQEYHNH